MASAQCPKCAYKEVVKAGNVKGKQRYKCKSCGYHFTVNKMGKMIDPYFVVKALQLHLEGLSYREIERILGINNVTIANWVKHFGVKKPFQYNYKPSYKILTSNQLKEYFTSNTLNSDSGFLVTPIGDKFMLINWKRFL